MKTDFYLRHFGFSERPFTLLPDPDLLFWSKAHKRAFSVLQYAMMTRAPLAVVTGEVGTGKTTLLHALLAQVEDDMTVGLISNAQGGRGELLRWVLNAFDRNIDPGTDYVALFQQFVDFVLEEYARGKTVILVIDEAQNLSPEALEELRMLTNINSNKDELLQLLLLGQPELREMILKPELRQFAQRVTINYHLMPMDQLTTREYIRFRLTHVGGSGNEITDAAADIVYKLSAGVPRVINKICDIALVYAASAEAPCADLDIIHELMEDGVILTANTIPYPLLRADLLSCCLPTPFLHLRRLSDVTSAFLLDVGLAPVAFDDGADDCLFGDRDLCEPEVTTGIFLDSTPTGRSTTNS